ncbi:hypothetical protein WMY93_022572 [Mugilogobius chulae]|uniref:ABC transmembrane type-1 domain-containing protein n=1 Tax=Mugilogobius chulae TaxID=88201 RepID=A0AAW0NC74_9GOBI
MDEVGKKGKTNPAATANLCSKIFFWWLNPLFSIGYKRPLEEDDLYEVLPEDGSQHLGEELQRYKSLTLDQNIQNAKSKQSPSLNRAIIRCYWKSYAVLGFFTFVVEVNKVVQPVFLGKIIQYFESYEPANSAALHAALGYAAGLSICTLGLAIMQHLYFYHVQRAGFVSQQRSHGKTTTGQIVNLLSNDVMKFDEVTLFLHFLWVAPLQAAAVVGFSGQRLARRVWSETAILTDSRIRTMNEVVSGMRIIKMYAWEKPFAALVSDIEGNL